MILGFVIVVCEISFVMYVCMFRSLFLMEEKKKREGRIKRFVGEDRRFFRSRLFYGTVRGGGDACFN